MAYYPPPGFNRASSGYGAFPGAPNMGPPPGMGGAPGLPSAPGMSPPPGMAAAPIANPLPGRPGSIPASFQAPPNMPANINFNAPVIRLGAGGVPPGAASGGDPSAGGGNRHRMGLGADSRDNRDGGRNNFGRERDAERTFVPPTMEEVRRTIFVAGLEDGVPADPLLEEVLGCGGAVRLRRWTRLIDADNKPCTFGFAEYEDANSLHLVSEIFKDGAVQIPMREKSGLGVLIKDDQDEVKKAKIQVFIDEKSAEYIDQWSKSKISDEELEFKLDAARGDLDACIRRLSAAETLTTNGVDANGDLHMGDPADGAEILNISVPAAAAGAQEDELSDIPAEMRETVAAEIKAFRDRSLQRDLERLKKEEELEAAERARSGPRASRLASPPPASASSGPNGAPLGPRSNVVAGAPQGPRAYRAAQMPKDYADGVNFTNGADHDDDDPASDEELERRREELKNAELEKVYLDQERRWLNVERRHIASLARGEAEDASEEASKAKRRDALAEKFMTFDDEEELRRPTELFYRDRKAWRRARADFRRMEREHDDKDRRDEEKELGREQRRLDDVRGMADDFLSQTADDIHARQKPSQSKPGFSLNLGGFSMGGVNGAAANGGNGVREDYEEEEEEDRAAKKSLGRSHRMQDMENLLDDEDDLGANDHERKALRTVDFKPLAPGEKMSDEERSAATRQLAASIPNDTASLFQWHVKWAHLTDTVIEEQLRPYVQKKIFESLGVQEDMLVEIIEGVVRDRGTPEKIVEELAGLLDEEAEGLARKVWRMVVFYSELEAQGLGGSASG